jgi:hypothetical protein
MRHLSHSELPDHSPHPIQKTGQTKSLPVIEVLAVNDSPSPARQKSEAVKLRPWSLVAGHWLSGLFHGQFFVGIVAIRLGFAACENFEFAERAKDKLNHIARAAFIIVVRAWANATD